MIWNVSLLRKVWLIYYNIIVNIIVNVNRCIVLISYIIQIPNRNMALIEFEVCIFSVMFLLLFLFTAVLYQVLSQCYCSWLPVLKL